MSIEHGRLFQFTQGDLDKSDWHILRVGVGQMGTVFLDNNRYVLHVYGMPTFDEFMLREIADFCERKTSEYKTAQLAAGLEGYKKMKAACAESADAQEAFGSLNIQIYEDMIAEEKLKEKLQGGNE